MEEKKKDEILQKTMDQFEKEKWGDGYDSIRVIITYDTDQEKVRTEVSKR